MGKDLKGKELGEGLCQIKDGRYVGRYTDKYGKRKSIYGHKLKEVKDKLNRQTYLSKMDVSDEVYSKMTVDELYKKWMNYKAKTIKQSSLAVYENHYYNSLKCFETVKITNISTDMLQEMFDELSNRMTPQSVCGYASTVKGIFSFAVQRGYLVVNPMTAVILQKNLNIALVTTKKRERKFFTQEQIERLIRFAKEKNRKHIELYRLILLTGMRCGEAVALTWDDIDFQNRIIHVNKTFAYIQGHTIKNITYTQTPKSATSVRDIPLCKEAEILLMEYKGSKYSSDTFVFINVLKQPHHSGVVSITFKRLVTDYNRYETEKAREEGRTPKLMPEVSIHALRHTFATRCFEKKIDPKVVQKYLGHSSISMTMDLYTHVSREKLRDDIEKINGTA